ncbi:hypothetical protein [Zhongshania sp. BJYM1]|uniref:hypothetical protein n=1 Tax=Zhongshania aquatica TaxID=2965069 RepID=UPI0022B38B1D|nr:hypothetical protein [Marortus sp. BJYM1]
MSTNVLLSIAAALNALVAFLHIGCIYYGATWYRFMGAGEGMATLAERGSIQPTIITSFIVLVFSIWTVYTLSGAGIICQLPFLRWILLAITAIYILRGVTGFFFYSNPLGRKPKFWLWSSAICLILGLVHLFGLKEVWALI